MISGNLFFSKKKADAMTQPSVCARIKDGALLLESLSHQVAEAQAETKVARHETMVQTRYARRVQNAVKASEEGK